MDPAKRTEREHAICGTVTETPGLNALGGGTGIRVRRTKFNTACADDVQSEVVFSANCRSSIKRLWLL